MPPDTHSWLSHISISAPPQHGRGPQGGRAAPRLSASELWLQTVRPPSAQASIHIPQDYERRPSELCCVQSHNCEATRTWGPGYVRVWWGVWGRGLRTLHVYDDLISAFPGRPSGRQEQPKTPPPPPSDLGHL